MTSTKILLGALLFATIFSCEEHEQSTPICLLTRWSSNYQNPQATFGRKLKESSLSMTISR
jgi:protein involved in temperature-dependent protein secretion